MFVRSWKPARSSRATVAALVLRFSLPVLVCACGAPAPRTAPSEARGKLPKLASVPPALPKPLPPLRLETDSEYREPPTAVRDLLTAPDPPEPKVHAASGRVALVYRQELVPIERLARPFLGLAGFRFDPVTHTSRGEPLIERVDVIRVNPAEPVVRAQPISWQPVDGALLDSVGFSPDGRHLVGTLVSDTSSRLAVFDTDSARTSVLPAPINAGWGAPCVWLDGDELLCRLRPEDLGEPPARKARPSAIEHPGGLAPARTYSNLLRDAHDERLFEYYFSAELGHVRLDGTFTRLRGTRGLLLDFSVSPNGRYAVLTRLKQPYSRFMRAERFPRDVEIWDLQTGQRLRQLELPSAGAQPTRGVPLGPREFAWEPGANQTLGWLARVPAKDQHLVDRWMVLDPPFTGATRQVVRSDVTLSRFGWTTAGTPYYITNTAGGTRAQVYLVRAGQSLLVWQGATEDVAAQPGRPLETYGDAGDIIELDGRVFLTSDGYSDTGPQPFLDALDLKTLEKERLYTSKSGELEQPLAVFDGAGLTLLTWRESPSEPPMLRLVHGSKVTTVWQHVHPYPELAKAERRLVQYTRADNVKLFGTLYLPPGYTGDARLPTLLWIYPSEFSQQRYAELPNERSYHFGHVKGPSPLGVVLAGYALLYNPTMPIIGDKRTVNDEYLSQLVANADAAVKHVVDIGVADPDRIAVAGRSYGAFSTANLLVHSRLFKSGIAISGAYNRTLTPFGFQSEQRSFWRAPEMYAKVSPFFHADSIEAPLLLIHGALDENAGTAPEQSERFFHALVGNGAPVRYVSLPYEGHQYYARESVLHIVSEMIEWLNRTLR